MCDENKCDKCNCACDCKTSAWGHISNVLQWFLLLVFLFVCCTPQGALVINHLTNNQQVYVSPENNLDNPGN